MPNVVSTAQPGSSHGMGVEGWIAPWRASSQGNTTADCAIVEGRQTVQELRSSFSTIHLARVLCAFGADLRSRDGATFCTVVEGPVRELHPNVWGEIYSIACEALRNAFAHTCATHIEAEIRFGKRLLRLRIRDDGKGIAPTTAEQGRTGHYGLSGMVERARRIGSKLVIWSGAGTGTEIELSVAGSIAYANSPGTPAQRPACIDQPDGWRSRWRDCMDWPRRKQQK